MAEGLTGKFKDFAKNVSFNDYSEYTEHLSTQTNRTHTGSVQCNGCRKSVDIKSVVGVSDKLNYGHALIYCDECKRRLLTQFQAEVGKDD